MKYSVAASLRFKNGDSNIIPNGGAETNIIFFLINKNKQNYLK